MTVIWFVIWLIANNIGDHEPLTFDPESTRPAFASAIRVSSRRERVRSSPGFAVEHLRASVSFPRKRLRSRRTHPGLGRPRRPAGHTDPQPAAAAVADLQGRPKRHDLRRHQRRVIRAGRHGHRLRQRLRLLPSATPPLPS